MSKKITLFVIIWIIVALFITGDSAIEIFLILILVGLLIAREFTDRFTTAFLKNRMNIFIIVLIIIFLFLVGIRLINYVGM